MGDKVLVGAPGFFHPFMDATELTVTGRGRRSGRFQKNLPPLKLKIEPQTWSRCTGMTGTSSLPAISSRPRRNGSGLPVRLMAPSAKMQTTWPASSSARARSMAPRASLPGATGIAFMVLSSQARGPDLKKPDQAMKRTKRWMQAPTSRPSAKERWLQTRRAGPFAGTFSCPTMRML